MSTFNSEGVCLLCRNDRAAHDAAGKFCPAPAPPDGTYLGDAVYVRMEPSQQLRLWTSNGYRETNVVILEPEVFRGLLAFAQAKGWIR